jgi:tetratricopeptide (TPR) repeat protein
MSSDIEALRRAALHDPAQRVRLADTLVAAGDATEAVRVCRAGLLRDPDDIPLRLALGRALSAAGDLPEAQAALLDAAKRERKRAQQAPAPADFDGAPTQQAERRPSSTLVGRPAPPPPSDFVAPPNGGGRVDLERVAAELLVGTPPGGEPEEVAPAVDVEHDAMVRAWDARRARGFIVLWLLLAVVAGGVVGTALYRIREHARQLAAAVERADQLTRSGTYEDDRAARDAYNAALRLQPRTRTYFAMVAQADARLAADHGDDTQDAGWAMLRRAEKEAARHPTEASARTDREMRQARVLLAVARGEACPTLDEGSVDADVAARCALQHGDVAAARRALGGSDSGPRALLALASLELGAGDLDAADAAYGRVLAAFPQHPRALAGRALVALERGETPTVTAPTAPVGPTTAALYHLAAGLAELARGKEADANVAAAELDAARQGIVHDGRLALLYGRAQLQTGRVAEAEQAMRIAERRDPNDGDVAVLDAEVALAKGYEEKVVTALSEGAPTPRRLAVLGRALCLAGRYREAAATLDAALARRPGDATVITYRAIARAHLGDAAGAIKELEKAAATLPSTTPRYGLGLLAWERHDLVRARSELAGAIGTGSESFRARALYGRALGELGKPAEALAELEPVTRDAPALVSAHAALGRLYVELGRAREARHELALVLEAKPTVDDRLAYAQALADLGLVDEGQKALAAAAEAGALAGRTAHLAEVLRSWKGGAPALQAAKALEKERRGPTLRSARLALDAGNAWRRAGQPRRAADDYSAALYGDPLHANLGLGRLELAQSDWGAAESSFRSALQAWERGPFGVDDQTEARVGLARALLARRSFEEAQKTLVACVSADPRAPEPHLWLARVDAERAQPDEARAEAARAAELDDRYADAWLLVGDLEKSHDAERARRAYRRFLELAPDAPQARAARRSLASLK